MSRFSCTCWTAHISFQQITLKTSMPIMTSVAMPSVILETLAGNGRVIERTGGLPQAD
jgi:hypothetical protein